MFLKLINRRIICSILWTIQPQSNKLHFSSCLRSQLSQTKKLTCSYSTGKPSNLITNDDTSSLSKNLPSTINSEDILNTKLAQIRKKVGLYALTRHTMRLSSAYLYVACTDKIPVEIFFDELNISDSFYSWFVLTELHVWMMMCRLMAEGKEGRFARNELVKMLWEDCGERLKLYKINSKNSRKILESLNGQFRAAIIAYDEVSDELIYMLLFFS